MVSGMNGTDLSTLILHLPAFSEGDLPPLSRTS